MIDCFVSYCADDAPDIHVDKLVEELRRLTNNEVNFRVYFEEEYGNSLKEFMRVVLLEAPAVLMLFGPKYKKRIDDTESSTGVYQEYDTVVSRLENLSSPHQATRVIPILWAGRSIEDAVPEYFREINLRACDLKGFRAVGVTQGRPIIPRATLQTYSLRLKDIAKQLLAVAQISNDDARSGRNTMFDRFVTADISQSESQTRTVKDIMQPKFELGTYDVKGFLDRYYTNTQAFRHLLMGNVGLVSGRKGSGKTTLVQIGEVEARDVDYFPVIDISVEKWNLHYLIQGNTYRQADGDFEYADLEVRLLDFIWPCFISLCMCNSLLQESHGAVIKPHDLIISTRIAEGIKKIAHSTATHGITDYAAIFSLSVEAAKGFIQIIVNTASNESESEFKVDVIQGATLRKFLESLFGKNCEAIKSGIFIKGNKRFLLCLDRFDNEIQQYRKDAIEKSGDIRSDRVRREVDWLSSLTLFVHKTLRPDRLSGDREIFEFFSKIKFLIVLPFDRIVELRNAQRDSIASETIEEIRWQPKELLTMMRKRIQVLHDIPDVEIDRANNQTPQQRFDRVVSLTYPEMPSSVYIAVGGKNYDIDLFLNVLRHSFFRPRDILIHYASILSYVDVMKKKRRKPEIEAIREAISIETRTIVNYEFIGELRDTWRNVEDVLGLFRGVSQILDARSVSDLIGSTDFRFYGEGATISDLAAKIDFLYRVGFLGYRLTRQRRAHKPREGFTFAFFSRVPPPPFDGDAWRKQFQFAIHPIFIDSLFLQTVADEPVLYFDWAELDALDRFD